ncbi:BTB and MATH domain-containing protein 38 [Aphelenchoides avenae]|nr:BTB and MATH domain-containing protein 38 [Aphelenchus avenae]
MSDNPPPNENASTSGDGPRAKKAKTSHSQSYASIKSIAFNVSLQCMINSGGSRQATLTLDIDDVVKFRDDNVKVEGDKITLSGIDWRITAEIVDGYLSVMLNGSHPSMSEWHCKVDFSLHIQYHGSDNNQGLVDHFTIFTHKSPERGDDQWMSVEDFIDEYKGLTASCELTTFNCYVTDGAFGCRARFHDVTFDFGQRYLYANKGFLAAKAECFEAMFFGDFADKNQDVVTLKKVKADDFADFLQALAPSPMPIDDRNVFTVLRMADRFQAQALVERCKNYLLRHKRNIRLVKKLQIADELLMNHFRDKLIANASKSDILEASKLENESKFSKLTWIKLFQKYIHHPGDSSDSDSDSDD